MIITLHRSGGFAAIPALSRPIVVDTARLSGAAASALEGVVAELADSGLPPVIPPPPGAADFRTLRLRVQSGESSRTWEFTDAAADGVLLAVIDLVERYV